MKIVGCDFHPRWHQIAVFDSDTGEISEYKAGGPVIGISRSQRNLCPVHRVLCDERAVSVRDAGCPRSRFRDL